MPRIASGALVLVSLAGCHLVFGHHPVPGDDSDAGRDAAMVDRNATRDRSLDLSRVDLNDASRSDLLIDPNLPAPRPIAPLSGSTALRLQPRFRWELPPGGKGAIVEICADRACQKKVYSESFAGSEGMTSSALLSGRPYFWQLRGFTDTAIGTKTSFTWQLFVAPSAPANPAPSAAWGNLADVDGNGFADLLIGAYASKTARVHLGGPTGIQSTFSTSVDAPLEEFGRHPSATDVNGDGFSDLVIGAPAAVQTQVYLNDGKAMFFAPSVTVGGGVAAAIGDVNGDGYGDLAAASLTAESCRGKVFLYLGGPNGPSSTPDRTYVGALAWSGSCTGGSMLGHSIDTAGDVNGDGITDFVLGTHSEDAVYVCLGATTLPTSLAGCKKIVGPHGGQFGWQVASAGDVNGDGYGDVAVGALSYSGYLGRVYLYAGSGSGALVQKWFVTGVIPLGALGHALSGAGDVDGDGYADILAGACAYQTTAPSDRAFLLRGAPSGYMSHQLPNPSSTNIRFGESVAGIGDTNGDGLSDLAVGSELAQKVFIYGWDTAGKAPVLKQTISGNGIGGFGINVGRTH